MRRILLSLLLVFALVAGACGSGSGVESGQKDDSAETADGSSTDSTSSDDSTSTITDATEPEQYESPLFDLLGFDPNAFDDIDFEQVERDRQILVKECMQDQGFEYEIQDFGDFAVFTEGPGGDLEWGTREFVEKYGFGNTTFFLEQFSEPMNEQSVDEMPVDPNQEYREALTDGEQQAYDRALYGDEPELFDLVDPETFEPINPETGEAFTDAEMEEFWINYVPSGCQNVGYDDFPGGEDSQRMNSFFEEFEDVFVDFEERFTSDPRIAAIEDDWRVCMTEKSYPFENQGEMYEDLNRRMEPIYEEVFNFASGSAEDSAFGFEGNGVDVETIEVTDAPSPFGPTGQPEISAETLEKLEEIQAYEIAIALADFDCSENQDDIYQIVQREIEEDFIRENQAAITAFLEREATEGK